MWQCCGVRSLLCNLRSDLSWSVEVAVFCRQIMSLSGRGLTDYKITEQHNPFSQYTMVSSSSSVYSIYAVLYASWLIYCDLYEHGNKSEHLSKCIAMPLTLWVLLLHRQTPLWSFKWYFTVWFLLSDYILLTDFSPQEIVKILKHL